MGRIVGDGHVYFYVQDVIVVPEYQQAGLGKSIVERLMQFLDRAAPAKSGAFLGLMTEPHLTRFYDRFGFETYPVNVPAMRIWRNGH